MLGSLFQAVASIGGSLLGSSANSRAADQATAANERAREEYRQAAQRGIEAIRAGTQNYADTINPLLTPNPVQIPMHRGLTPNQQIGREDLLRQARATVAASGLRGAGRAGVGQIMDADRRFVANAQQANDTDSRAEMRRAQGVSDNARRGLADVYAREGGAIAGVETRQGNLMGQSMAQDGVTRGQATTANGNLWGETIGSLGSVIANETRGANEERYRAVSGGV